MSDRRVAKRYAEGFLAFAKGTIGAKAGLEELMSLGNILKDDPGLLKFLKNPEISRTQKADFIEKAFKDIFSEETREFITLVVDKHRGEEIADIALEARELYYAEMGMEKAVIKSARALSPELLNSIKDRLEERSGKKLEVETAVDPGLIGGIQATVGHVVIDGSIKRKISELREHLMEIKVD